MFMLLISLVHVEKCFKQNKHNCLLIHTMVVYVNNCIIYTYRNSSLSEVGGNTLIFLISLLLVQLLNVIHNSDYNGNCHGVQERQVT